MLDHASDTDRTTLELLPAFYGIDHENPSVHPAYLKTKATVFLSMGFAFLPCA